MAARNCCADSSATSMSAASITSPCTTTAGSGDAVFADGSLFKAGYGGQGLLVSPRHHLVVAFVSSWPAMDRQDYNRFQWIARQLIHAGAFR